MAGARSLLVQSGSVTIARRGAMTLERPVAQPSVVSPRHVAHRASHAQGEPLSAGGLRGVDCEGGVSNSIYDPRRDLLAFLEGLEVTQGRLAGRRLSLLPWERRFLRGVFRPGVQSAGLSVGRGNGKTTLLAGVGAATLIGPLATVRGDTVIVASSFEQARICFEHVLAFLEGCLGQRTLRETFRVWDTAQQGAIQHRETGARVRCIGSDPRRAHGLSPVLVLADEPAQWESSKSSAMVAALRTAMGKQPGARFVAIGTRPADPEHWFAKLLESADYAQVHAAERTDPKFHRRTWRKANPSLPAMPDLLLALEAEATLARRDPAMLAAFDALRLNLGTADTERAMLLDAGTWVEIEGEADATGPTYWGVDLGSTAAQSAIACYWPRTGRLEAVAAFPAIPSLEQRGLTDAVGRLYAECWNRGELLTLGENTVPVDELVRAASQRWGAPSGLAADRWREGELRDALKLSGLPVAPLELRGQGYKDGAEDVRTFRRACLEGKVTPSQSLLLASAMAEARTVTDPSGNSKLAKGSEGGRRLRARDDAAAAAILAVATGAKVPVTKRRLSLGLAG